MKFFLSILFAISCLFPIAIKAQLESVIVETYYISDANDATDTTGGMLESGSKTYRIYVNLVAGSKLKKIYADENHLLRISSTSYFYNNTAYGQSFGKDFSLIALKRSTAALDTWLTLGQVTKASAKTYFGILKSEDLDGSVIGGINSDGGSAIITEGLLTNSVSAIGIPLTVADGLDTLMTVPSNWASSGITVDGSTIDSTIFGSLVIDSQFVSKNAILQASGVVGVTSTNNILIAQLTTKGEITFDLNIEVEDTSGISIKYVSNDSVLLAGEKLSRYLKYPFTEKCGCPDPNYLEYANDRDRDCGDSCKTLIVYGCTDPMACNYDPNANFNIQDICCYPGYCKDRDISLVCADLLIDELNSKAGFDIYPNPASDVVELKVTSSSFNKDNEYWIYDSFGRLIIKKHLNDSNLTCSIDVSSFASGLYLVQLHTDVLISNKLFVIER